MPDAFASTPEPSYESFLEQRKLTRETADLLGYVPLSADATAQYLGYAVGPAVLLQYFDEKGAPLAERPPTKRDPKPEAFGRLRLFQREGSGKYQQRKGTHSHARLTPNCKWDWTAVGRNTDIPVLFTEGEFKADQANRKDGLWGDETRVAVVGFGGVDSWKGNGTGKPLVPEIDGWLWEGRRVYIAYDYDGKDEEKGYKKEVWASIERLCNAMAGLGAQVTLVHLHKTSKAQLGVKMGLDDYILAGGGWDELRGTEEGFKQSDGRAMLRQRYGLFNGHPIDLVTGVCRPYSQWDKAEMGSYFYEVGDKRHQAINVWKMDPERVVVDRLAMEPLEPFGVIDVEDGKKAFNLWQGYGVEAVRNDELVKDWLALVRGVVGADLEARFHQWTAWALQHPEKHNFTSWFLVSPHGGIGKSLIGETVARCAGRAGYIGGPESMDTDYNEHMVLGKVIVAINELGAEKGDYKKFKHFRTAGDITTEEKFKARSTVKNLMNFIVTSNEIATHKTTKAERRDVIVRVKGAALSDEWKAWLSGGVARRLVSAEGTAAILWHYLHGVDCSGWDYSAKAPETDGKNDAAEQTESVAEQKAREIMEAIGPQGFIDPNTLRLVCRDGEGWRVVRKHLYALADHHWAEVVKLDGASVRCICWDNTEQTGAWLNRAASKVEELRRCIAKTKESQNIPS